VALLSPQQLSAFCPETLVVARRYAHDFEKFGIHLQGAQQRAQAARLLAQHQHFPALFNAALVGCAAVGLCCWWLVLLVGCAAGCGRTPVQPA
jgi:hypothetical protein